MPPLCPTSATGPSLRPSGRSSVSVTRRLLAQMLPMQFGPDTASQVAAERFGPAVERLAEAGGEYRGAAGARGGAAAQQLGHGGCRHYHDQMVGRLRQGGEIRVAGRVENILAARVDQIDRAGKTVAVEIAPGARGPTAGTVADADHHGVTRLGQRRDLFLGCFQIHQMLLLKSAHSRTAIPVFRLPSR